MDILKKLFGETAGDSSSREQGGRLRDARVATCALFLEMANTDGRFSEQERKTVLAAVKKEYALSDETVAELVEAAERERRQSIDFWGFTNRINAACSEEEKLGIIEMLWRIIYTDGILDKHEDYLVHKLSSLLHLTHQDLIDAKMKVLHRETESL